jgi:hypothetical protein
METLTLHLFLPVSDIITIVLSYVKAKASVNAWTCAQDRLVQSPTQKEIDRLPFGNRFCFWLRFFLVTDGSKDEISKDEIIATFAFGKLYEITLPRSHGLLRVYRFHKWIRHIPDGNKQASVFYGFLWHDQPKVEWIKFRFADQQMDQQMLLAPQMAPQIRMMTISDFRSQRPRLIGLVFSRHREMAVLVETNSQTDLSRPGLGEWEEDIRRELSAKDAPGLYIAHVD